MKEFHGAGARYYDMYDTGLWGDVDFYVQEATKSGSPVLELGCGTGRILLPIAESGVEIVGLDRSADMLEIAKEKIAEKSEAIQNRISLVEGNIERFHLDRPFRLIMIPHRTFMHIMTTSAQKDALHCIREHLTEDGRLIFNVVTPPVEEVSSHIGYTSAPVQLDDPFIDPATGRTVFSWSSRRYDPGIQLVEQYYIFDELDDFGAVLSRSYTVLKVRYTHRYEMQHLLELCGFSVEALYGDFMKGPHRYGLEQIWVAKKA